MAFSFAETKRVFRHDEKRLFKFHSIHSVILVFNPIQILQVGAHLLGGLGDLRHFDVFELIEA